MRRHRSSCRDNNLPLRVFDLHNSARWRRILRGEDIGTLVSNDSRALTA
jgi:uridylate kinase